MIEMTKQGDYDASEQNSKPLERKNYVYYVAKYRYFVLIGGCVLMLGLIGYWKSVFDLLKSGGFDDPNSESTLTTNLFDTLFVDPNPDTSVILEHPHWNVSNPKFRQAFYEWKYNLGNSVNYYGIIDIFATGYPQQKSLISDNDMKTLVVFRGTNLYPYSTFSSVATGGLTAHYSGGQMINDAISDQLKNDLLKIEVIAVPILLVLMLFVYGGLTAMIPPIMLSIWTLSLTLTGLNLLASNGFSVTTYATDVAIAFGVGIAIDYSLFMFLRLSEELHKMPSGANSEEEMNIVKIATERTLGTSGRTVFFSAILLMSSLSGALAFNLFYLSSMAATMIFIAFSAAFGALTIVPAFYFCLGRSIFSLNINSLAPYFKYCFKCFFPRENDEDDPTSHNVVSNYVSESAKEETNDNKSNYVIPNPNASSQSPHTNESKVAAVSETNVTNYENHANTQRENMDNPLTSNGNDGDVKTGVLETDSVQHSPSQSPNKYTKSPTSSDFAGHQVLPTMEDDNDDNNDGGSNSKSKMKYSDDLITAEDLKDPWFRAISFIVKYPWPFLGVVLGCLGFLTASFVINVRLAGFDWTNLSTSSPIRYTNEAKLYDFTKNIGPTNLDVFIQLDSSQILTNKSLLTDFIIQLDTFCTNLESLSFVKNVQSIVRLDPSYNLSQYINIYTNPNVPSNAYIIGITKDPFFLYNGYDITRVSMYLNTQLNDPTIGYNVRKVRSLLHNSFFLPDKSSMLSQSGVTGSAAVQYDTLTDLGGTLPVFIAVVVIAMFFFVLLLTGSIFLPFKAIVTSGLNIMSCFAFVMYIIQYGNGAAALNFRANFEALDPTILLFVFVIGFGLSLDYEVFILGRIQEVYLDTGDYKYAICKGVSSSARAVTSAAVLLCVAICGFLSSSVLVLQMIGLGIGLIVMMDATVIRCVLIPAVLAVAGDWAWYAPYPVKKAVEFCGIRH